MKLKKADVDHKLEALISKRDHLRNNLLSTSDSTRDTMGTIQDGLYITQLGMSIFRTLTNYHLSPKKRYQKVAASLLLVVASKLLKKYLSSTPIEPEVNE